MEWKQLPYKGDPYDDSKDTLVRQSTINQIKWCGYRTKLADHDGYLEAVSEKMVFGSCEHYLIAKDLEVGEVRLDLLASMKDWVEELLVTDYNWSLSKVTNVGDFFSELASAYTQWRSVVQPTLSTLVTQEEEMWMPLGEGIHLKGTPDGVFEDVIIDWKTSGRAWKESKAHTAIQADLYMALVKQNLGLSIRKWIFWVYDRGKRVWQPIPTTRRVADINTSLLSALDYGLALEAGTLQATPTTDTYGEVKRGWYCSPKYCSAWNICPAKFINDGVDEKAIATRTWL